MKRNNKLGVLTLILTMILLTFSGCSSTDEQKKEARKDQGFINNDNYKDESYWKSSDLKLVTDVNLKITNENPDFSDCNFEKLSRKESKKVEYLKDLIYEFFLDVYNLDFSSKLEKQSVTWFNSTANGNSLTMGYVDPKDENTLHLHISSKDENAEVFVSTYVHETLHQIGFIDKSQETTYIVEGIVDAFADLILARVGEEYIATPIYFETRQLGYQLIKADKELPNVFYKKESFKEHLNSGLSKYNQVYEKHEDLTEYLNTLLFVLIQSNSGQAKLSYDPYFYAFDAQAIVQKFCQSKKPNSSTIKYLRKHCILEEFEDLKVKKEGNGYQII